MLRRHVLMPTRLDRATVAARESVLRSDAEALGRVHAFVVDLVGRVAPLATVFARAVANLTERTVDKMFALASWTLLHARVASEVAALAAFAESVTMARRREVVTAAATHAKAQVLAAVPKAMQTLVSHRFITPMLDERDAQIPLLGGGTLADWRETLPTTIAGQLKTAVSAVVEHATVFAAIVATVQKVIGYASNRAMLLVRTEPVHAARSATIKTYAANPGIVRGWRFVANPGACPVCMERDGEEHGNDEAFESHPNCACQPEPITDMEGIAA